MLLASSIDRGFGEIIKQVVGFAVEHTIALLDGGLADGLCQMTFSGAGRTEKQSIFVTGDEGAGGQVEDQTAIHLGVEVEVEVVQGFLRVAKLSLLAPALQQTIATTSEFVRDQAGDQVDGWHGFDLSLVETSFEHCCDSTQP